MTGQIHLHFSTQTRMGGGYVGIGFCNWKGGVGGGETDRYLIISTNEDCCFYTDL